jgi:hypothetical protein
VPARVGGHQPVVLVDLLADLDRLRDEVALAVGVAAAAFVERERRIDQFALVVGEVLRAVERGVGLLAAGQGHLDGPRRLVAFLLEADQSVGPGRRHHLVVGDAAGVVVAVLLDQLERVALPVVALGLHHVDVRQQQHRLERGGCTGIHRHDPALLRMLGHGEQGDPVFREAGCLQSRRDLFGGPGAVAIADRGVGLHQFLVELEELLLVRPQLVHLPGRHLGRQRARHERRDSQRDQSLHRCFLR